MHTDYITDGPTRAQIDAMPGAVVVEFGTAWCGWCQGAQPAIREAFAGATELTHLRIEDGQGRPAGRSFGVKLWPTLVFLHHGREVARVVRPSGAAAVVQALDRLRRESAPGP